MLVVAGMFTKSDVDAMSERLVQNVEMPRLVAPSGTSSEDEAFDQM